VKLAILHPGEMGVTVGAAMKNTGHEVFWLPQARSTATAGRAENAGFQPCGSLPELVGGVQGIVSVCPPHGAVDLAHAVMAAGFQGIFVDANALSPDTAREIASIVGARFVDGGIIGPPAHHSGSTRLYVSGSLSEQVIGWFAQGPLDARAIAGGPGAASALKMCYAAYTKGSSALLLAVRALADAEGVEDGLLGEWEISQPGLARRSELAAQGSAPKAWRFVGEMREIAKTFRSAGLPGDFHDGAAELYRRMETLRNSKDITFDDVLAQLNDDKNTHHT
jgi:3-hydroxyisobutyrate dehydrogenase-like beta-hydroxyacid dehydrogenase